MLFRLFQINRVFNFSQVETRSKTLSLSVRSRRGTRLLCGAEATLRPDDVRRLAVVCCSLQNCRRCPAEWRHQLPHLVEPANNKQEMKESIDLTLKEKKTKAIDAWSHVLGHVTPEEIVLFYYCCLMSVGNIKILSASITSHTRQNFLCSPMLMD